MNEAIVAQILSMVQTIDKKLDVANERFNTVEVRFTRHMVDEEAALVDIHKELGNLNGGFPNGDIQGHHNYHYSLIERNKYITEICKLAVKEVAKYGLLGFIVWLVYHAWIDLLAGPHK